MLQYNTWDIKINGMWQLKYQAINKYLSAYHGQGIVLERVPSHWHVYFSMNKQSGRRYSLGSLLRKIPQRNKRVKGFKINSTATIAVKLTDLHLFLAELVDNIFQQGLENQFCVLDILREVTFSRVTWGSQESSSSFQSTPCLWNCISWNIKKKNLSAGSHPILISWHVE